MDAGRFVSLHAGHWWTAGRDVYNDGMFAIIDSLLTHGEAVLTERPALTDRPDPADDGLSALVGGGGR